MTKFATACQNLWKKIKAQPFQSLLVLVFLVLAGLFVAVAFDVCSESIFSLLGIREAEGGPSRKYQALRFLGFGMGGVLVALQALMSYRRAKAMEDAVLNTEQGQRQERLKNAIEHLGNKKDSVRLGGAYELFHLAQDTDTPELRQTMLDILCAHIRQTTSGDEYREKHEVEPSEEVQSMLTLLFVQEHEVFKKRQINLQGSWLNGASLAGARLAKADLSRARLQGAHLREARLQGTVLMRVQLQGADLVGAQLQGAHLGVAQLQGAILGGAQLQGADLGSARLQGADLGSARLQEAHLGSAWLQGAILGGTQLQGARLGGARLQGAWLGGTQLQGANLRGVQLQGAGFQAPIYGSFEERIRNRIGERSDLSDVVFAGGLSQEDIDSLVKGLSDEQAQRLRKKLKPHLGKPSSNKPPAEAKTGAYTAEDAEQWIAEYKQAMSEVPKAEAD